MSRANSTDRKLNPAGLAEIISRKSATNLKSTFANKGPKLTDKLDCKRKAASGYYRFKRLEFNNRNEIEEWLDAEGE